MVNTARSNFQLIFFKNFSRLQEAASKGGLTNIFSENYKFSGKYTEIVLFKTEKVLHYRYFSAVLKTFSGQIFFDPLDVCCISITPENVRKSGVFWCFQVMRYSQSHKQSFPRGFAAHLTQNAFPKIRKTRITQPYPNEK